MPGAHIAGRTQEVAEDALRLLWAFRLPRVQGVLQQFLDQARSTDGSRCPDENGTLLIRRQDTRQCEESMQGRLVVSRLQAPVPNMLQQFL